MIINKIEIEFYQEADNEVGSEDLTITANPALIGLYNNGKSDHYYTLKSEHGWSFDDGNELMEMFRKVESIMEKVI